MAHRRLGRCGITVQELMDMADDDDLEPVDVFMEPPEANTLTDEDSDEDEEFGPGDINHLTGRQLLVQTEVRKSNNERIGGTAEEDDELIQMQCEAPVAVSSPPASPVPPAAPDQHVGVQAKQKIRWIAGDFEKKDDFSEPDYSRFGKKNPVEMFELFFDDGCIQLLYDETQKYATFKNLPDPKISKDELRCFLAILLVSGYDMKPNLRGYWDSESDMRNAMVYNAMRRNRFCQIMQFLHCADNLQIDFTDKAYKIRPLMEKIKKNFLSQVTPEQDMDYDESMVKYFGRHGCKQFIRGKPVRFGYKMWCLNTSSGYLINFDLYQGKNPKESTYYENLVGKAAAPLLLMVDELPEQSLRYNFFTDNLFTSPNLLVTLKHRGYDATGTMRENRVPKSLGLEGKKTMMKRERGTLVHKIDKTNGIIYMRWKDNGVVTVASTAYGVVPKHSEGRFSRTEKKKVKVEMPDAIKKYNRGMGGTDLMDQNLARHRIGVRGKKWWWCLFTWLVDACVQNAWLIHKKSGHNVTQLQFRREIAQSYLVKYGTPPSGGGRPRTSGSTTGAPVSDLRRYDRLDHLVAYVEGKKRRRCAAEGCSTSARTYCKKCNVGLCIEDFETFHKL